MSSAPAPETEPTWSDIAGWYDARLTEGSGPHETARACLRRMVPDLAGATVLDLACGQGYATRALLDAGARTVIGIDSSPEMIELARARTAPAPSVSYRVDDGQHLRSCADRFFDGATCQLGLMDIPDLTSALAAVRRVLKPGGWLAFVIGHPCFLAARLHRPRRQRARWTIRP
jgi:ubiquinone/menaquinone biosynthesis C-methylase UbiE